MRIDIGRCSIPTVSVGGQPQQLLYGVQQFADVARPAVSLECLKRVIGERQRSLRPLEKMRRQRLDVFGPLAKWRHVEMDDLQPVQQVLAELAGRHQVAQVAVGGRDHPNVDARLRLIRTHGLDLAVLEKPQQERLHAQAHLADFVQEQRAAMRQLELAALVAVGAGEAAFDVSEQLGLEERFRQAGAVHGHEWRLLASRVAVNVARD